MLRHLPLVRYIASHTRPRTGQVEVEDLVSAGTIALIEAIDRFDPDHGAAFTTFAYPRIKGAIIDEMSKLAASGAPRGGNSDALSLEAPLAGGRDHAEITLIDVTVDRSFPEPQRSAEFRELLDAVRELPPRERELIALSAAGTSLGEIAGLWGCSESRVSQLLTRARFRLEERTAA